MSAAVLQLKDLGREDQQSFTVFIDNSTVSCKTRGTAQQMGQEIEAFTPKLIEENHVDVSIHSWWAVASYSK